MLKENKKGMVQQLTVIGYGIIGLAILVGIGLTVLTKLGDTTVQCAAAFPTWNTTLQLCQNSTGSTAAGTGTAYTAVTYAATQLGSSGLLGWLPAIIALLIGVFFLMYFMGRKKGY